MEGSGRGSGRGSGWEAGGKRVEVGSVPVA
jgi:hypothetical protein